MTDQARRASGMTGSAKVLSASIRAVRIVCIRTGKLPLLDPHDRRIRSHRYDGALNAVRLQHIFHVIEPGRPSRMAARTAEPSRRPESSVFTHRIAKVHPERRPAILQREFAWRVSSHRRGLSWTHRGRGPLGRRRSGQSTLRGRSLHVSERKVKHKSEKLHPPLGQDTARPSVV